MIKTQRTLSLCLMAVLAAFGLGACGGGGGGGGGSGGGSGSPILLEITAAGASAPLWQNVGGTPTTPAQCPAPISLNSVLTFRFAGPVAQSSLPSTGIAAGSINISTTDGTTTISAAGSFAVQDDPALEAGNQRLVVFLPTPPTDPLMPAATSGLAGSAAYTIFIPRGGNSAQVVNVGGSALQTEALCCFNTCVPPVGGNASICFTDPVPGAPFIVATIPESSDPSGILIDPASVVANTVTIFVSEPLFPSGIDRSNVRLINSASGAQVPGSVQFFQAGSPEAGPDTARIDYVALDQLLSGVTYEIVINPVVRDFGDLSVVSYDPTDPNAPPSGRRLFGTENVPFCRAPDIVEDFTTNQNEASSAGVVIWSNTGMLTSTFPLDVIGDGTFGPLVVNGPGPVALDTGGPTMPGFENGNWNATMVSVAAGATARLEGPFRAHFRSLGTITIDGTVNGSAGTSTALTSGPESGPATGIFNQGGSMLTSIVRGGTASAGGGNGGRASQEGFTTRTDRGETGFGATVNGQPNPGPAGANPFFGGGQGGVGNFRFPAGGTVGDFGGGGAAGGSAWQAGSDSSRFSAAQVGCTPQAPGNQPPAMATAVPAAMVFPISVSSAGSGGGGGGDRHETTGVTNDDQGGGGGGGGGGFRATGIGDVTLNGGSTVNMDGANGAAGNSFFGGGGGGGSGGQIWLQSFSQLVISSAASLRVNGGTGSNNCSDHASGGGGAGLYQLEDTDLGINTMFAGSAAQMGNNISQLTILSPTMGIATSNFFDTNYGDTDYLPGQSSEVFEVNGANPAPGASVVIEYQGAFETLGGGQADLTSLSPWVTRNNLDMIDGRRYIRFRVTISFDPPNGQGTGTTINNTLPTVSNIVIAYETPIVCP